MLPITRRMLLCLSSLALGAISGDAQAVERSIYPLPDGILVRFSESADPDGRASLMARCGTSLVAENSTLAYATLRPTTAADLTGALARLRRESDVVWAEPNAYYHALGIHDLPQDPMTRPLGASLAGGENQWGLFATGIPWLWRQGALPGAGVRIAVVDTGIDDWSAPHPDLADNIHPVGKDFVDDDSTPTDSGSGAALYGHGTHVAGIAAASANDQGIAGVAYGGSILVVRALDCNAGDQCPGSYSDLAEAIQWAADQEAKVINLSLGGVDPSNAVRSAIQYAIRKGAVVVAAAGNDGADSLSYPARYPEVIAVGAVDTLAHVPTFSNSGPELDLVAPGVGVWSTVPGGGYADYEGTSQAAPFVSGVAAVLIERNPDMRPPEIERYLRSHATPLNDPDAARDGEGSISFPLLEDWSDAPPPYDSARHLNFAWEWLGRDASHENSVHDVTGDGDLRPNLGAPDHADGHDDGLLPQTYSHLPFLPPHLGSTTPELELLLSVSRRDGPRYSASPDKQLHVDTWVDWDSDGLFEAGAAAEHVVVDHRETPPSWPGNSKLISIPFTPVDEHILGNPLRIRTRLNYGAAHASPGATADFGEVEDIELVNFVEDFDTGSRVHSPGVYTITDSWSVVSDPAGPCGNHGTGGLALSTHPAIGAPCNGFIERINVMATPAMDWSEYTDATLRFWFCHRAFNCSPSGDFCRVRIDANGTKTNLGPIPVGSGSMEIDLSAFVGHDVVFIEFVEETDFNGQLNIDDITVVAHDAESPAAVTDLAVARVPGSNRVSLALTAPDENPLSASPPTDTRANIFELRFARGLITSESDWESALRLDPRDLSSASTTLQPADAGASQVATVDLPSAFQSYSLALRTLDEVTLRSGISNSPGVSGSPTVSCSLLPLGFGLGAPGDTVLLSWELQNLGNAPDLFGIAAESAHGWEMLNNPDLVAVDAGGSVEFELSVVIPNGAAAGEQDTLSVQATSFSDPAVHSLAENTVTVLGPPTEATGPSHGPAVDHLRLLGAVPIRDELRVELQLGSAAAVSMRLLGSDGREVSRLLARDLDAGRHELAWPVDEIRRSSLAAGVYFLETVLRNSQHVRRLVILR
ncbi:MAG: S8 family serine peptidase [Candidatus Eisenbacteria bacterium]|nr:S8 family serine peptidase [Candidatus Eisenbacteria bacterium]